jgi:hypothetical protein
VVIEMGAMELGTMELNFSTWNKKLTKYAKDG